MSATRGEHDSFFEGSFKDDAPSLLSAAHELKTPLTLIRQLSLMLELGEVSIDEQKRMLSQITLTSEKALRLTSDLTRSVNLSGAMFRLEPINPYQLCEDIIYELKPLFAARGRELKLKSRKHPLLLVGNRDLLRRIITNFSDNALHYADDKKSIDIRISAIDSGQMVRLSVRDYGPALSTDLFNALKYKKLETPGLIKSRPNSSGLGVYIAGQFAEAMNGKLGVKRHRDGSTFYIDLYASRQLNLL